MNKKYLVLAITILFDLAAVVSSLLLSFFTFNSSIKIPEFVFAAVILSIITIVFFYLFKIYNVLWRFSGIDDIIRIIAGCFISLCTFCFVMYSTGHVFSIRIYVSTLLLMSLFYICERLMFKKVYSDMISKKSDNFNIEDNIMIIGGGYSGYAIINDIKKNTYFKVLPVKCIIDDNKAKKDQFIGGIRIVGGRETILENVKKYKITLIIFAIPSCPSKEKSEILNICKQTDCELKTLPSLRDMLNAKIDTTAIRKVEIEDLLGREPIEINISSIFEYIGGKNVLVTGGGGSIGSELCRQIAYHNPATLIIFDIYENNAYEIQNELARNYPNLNLVTLIGSVRDSKRLDCIFTKYQPQIVFHAAAHKHVPLMEYSPNESLKNNVFGTYKVAECSVRYNVNKFVFISTDKAVNPTNVMGASKRICEMIIQSMNNKSKTDFVAVRFGNVLGSNGSVIPLFKKQIENGGPVTVTDPNIIRYFMTIPEAVSLVLEAGASAQGGEIFVLDMGNPVKIIELAENLIRLSGFEPYTEMKIKFTGLRPGEKLYEELLMEEEGLISTNNRLIFIGKPIEFDESALMSTLDEMRELMYDDNSDIRRLVKRIVPTYTGSANKE